MKAYHFLRADFTAGGGDEPAWEVGETRTVKKPQDVRLCEYGYHSCSTLWDALGYAPGPLACLVDVSAPVAKDSDKQVSVSRTLIKAVNIGRELRLFAADCAERVLYIFEQRYPDDKRPRLAIQAARNFANGKIDAATRDAASAAARAAAWAALRATAWSAARDAAWDAARDAAWDAARAAAWAALRAAAWSAARDAAWDAARAAAWAAAWSAARDAAWDAARTAETEWQKQHFNKMFGHIFD